MVKLPHTQLKKAQIGQNLVNQDADVSTKVKIVGFDRKEEELRCIDVDTDKPGIVSIKVDSDSWIVTKGDSE